MVGRRDRRTRRGRLGEPSLPRIAVHIVMGSLGIMFDSPITPIAFGVHWFKHDHPDEIERNTAACRKVAEQVRTTDMR